MSRQLVQLFRRTRGIQNETKNPNLRVPLLNAEGEIQALNIIESDTFFTSLTLILVSPLRRCMQTALMAFHPAFNGNVTKIFLKGDPHNRITSLTRSNNPCDADSALTTLKQIYGKFVEFPDEIFPKD